MGNHPSRPETSAPQPDDTRQNSISRRASRLTSRVSLRSNAGPAELEGDPNVTRYFELPDTSVRPEMVVNPRSVAQLGLPGTYLQAHDTRLPVELSAQPSTTRRQSQMASIPERGPQVGPTTTRQTQGTPTATRNLQRSSTGGIRPQTTRTATGQPARPTSLTQPAQVQQLQPQPREDPAQLSRNIASISNLLREMYSLDLKIFGRQNGRSQDEEERNRMIDQADVLFQKIKTTLDRWDAQSELWTDDERRILRNIRRTAERYPPKRNQTRSA
jgi:hypothetical protein